MRQRRIERKLNGITVVLDGYDWYDCEFKDCTLVINDIDFAAVNCSFNAIKLKLGGRALALATFLQGYFGDRPITFYK